MEEEGVRGSSKANFCSPVVYSGFPRLPAYSLTRPYPFKAVLFATPLGTGQGLRSREWHLVSLDWFSGLMSPFPQFVRTSGVGVSCCKGPWTGLLASMPPFSQFVRNLLRAETPEREGCRFREKAFCASGLLFLSDWWSEPLAKGPFEGADFKEST